MRDSMYDDTALRMSLPPAARTNGTVNGTAVDMRGSNNFFQVGMLIVQCGAITDGSNAIVVQDSDDGASGWVNFGGNVQGAVPALAVAQSGLAYRMALDSGMRRFLRAVITTTGATTGGIICVSFLLRGDSGARPVT